MPRINGMFPCGHYHICRFVESAYRFTDADRQKMYHIKQFINRSTTQVLYIFECPCKKFYVGKTKHQLRVRVGEHLNSIRNKNNPKGAPLPNTLMCFTTFSQGVSR